MTTTLRWQVMQEQPPEGFRCCVSDCDNSGAWWLTNMPRQNGQFPLSEFAKWEHVYPKAPHRPGEVLPVKEEWMPTAYEGAKGVLYRGSVEAVGARVKGDWQPAETLPDFAVRRFERVLSCRPIQAKDVTEEEAERCGFAPQKELDPAEFGEPYSVLATTMLIRLVGGPSVWIWLIETESEVQQ